MHVLYTIDFLLKQVRTIISDFAVTIGIAVMVLFDMVMKINTAKLKVPKTFRVRTVMLVLVLVT